MTRTCLRCRSGRCRVHDVHWTSCTLHLYKRALHSLINLLPICTRTLCLLIKNEKSGKERRQKSMRKRNYTVTIRMNKEEYHLLQSKVKAVSYTHRGTKPFTDGRCVCLRALMNAWLRKNGMKRSIRRLGAFQRYKGGVSCSTTSMSSIFTKSPLWSIAPLRQYRNLLRLQRRK